jgi:hypothetical protein
LKFPERQFANGEKFAVTRLKKRNHGLPTAESAVWSDAGKAFGFAVERSPREKDIIEFGS